MSDSKAVETTLLASPERRVNDWCALYPRPLHERERDNWLRTKHKELQSQRVEEPAAQSE